MMKLNPQQFANILASLQAAAESGGSEKRGFPRYDVQTKLTMAPITQGAVGSCYTVLSRDISASGLGFFQNSEFNSKQTFLALLPSGKEPVLVSCSTSFCRSLAHGVYCVGAQFESIADKELMAQFAKSVKANLPAEKAA